MGTSTPRLRLASVLMTGNPMRLATYIPAQILGAIVRCSRGMAAIQAALGANGRRGHEVCLFCDSPCRVSAALELFQRGAGNLCSGPGGDSFVFEARRSGWSCCRSRANPGGRVGLGNRAFVRRNDRICDQSCSRPRAADRSFSAAHCRQGRVRLAVRVGADPGSVGWCGPGGSSGEDLEHVLVK